MGTSRVRAAWQCSQSHLFHPGETKTRSDYSTSCIHSDYPSSYMLFVHTLPNLVCHCVKEVHADTVLI